MKYLDIKKPSLYNHIKTIEDVHRNIMIYGWSRVSVKIVEGIDFADAKENPREYEKR